MSELEFGAIDLADVAGEDKRLNNTEGSENTNFLDQFVPMPEVRAGATGIVTVRILPPIKGARLYQYNRTHKINGRSIHCPKPLLDSGKWDRNVYCPICDYYSSLWSKIDALEKQYGKNCDQAKDIREEAKAIKPVERYYYNAIVRSMVVDGKEEKDVGPRILSVGKSLHSLIIRAIVGIAGDPDSKLGDISNLKTGYDLVIRKTVTAGKDAYPNYDTTSFARTSSPAGDPSMFSVWAANIHDLKKLRNPKDKDYLEKELAIYKGLIPDDISESKGFNEEEFAKKFGGTSTTTQVSVPGTVTEAPQSTSTATESVETSSSDNFNLDDINIDNIDTSFLEDIKG